MNYLIRDLNQDEKPREKLIHLGVSNLSDTELVALIIRSGGFGVSAIDLSREMLKKFGGLSGLPIDIKSYLGIKFLNVAKASGIVAAIEIGLRLNTIHKGDQTKLAVSNPKDVAGLLKKDLYGAQKEHLYLVSLNSRNKVISKDLLAIGTINETLLSPREIFRQAFLRNAVSIILAHNHPSNDPTPSSEDLQITKKVEELAEKIGIRLIDHVIICDSSFMSIKAYKTKGGENSDNQKLK